MKETKTVIANVKAVLPNGVIKHCDITIEGEKIINIEASNSASFMGCTKIDGKNRYLLPGTIATGIYLPTDLKNTQSLQKLAIASGITSILAIPTPEEDNVLLPKQLFSYYEMAAQTSLPNHSFYGTCVESSTPLAELMYFDPSSNCGLFLSEEVAKIPKNIDSFFSNLRGCPICTHENEFITGAATKHGVILQPLNHEGKLPYFELQIQFQQFLNHEKNMPDIIKETAERPAAKFRIKNRGMIKNGYYADLVMIKLEDLSYEIPENDLQEHSLARAHKKLLPKIIKVWVNGNLAYNEGMFGKVPGKQICFNRE